MNMAPKVTLTRYRARDQARIGVRHVVGDEERIGMVFLHCTAAAASNLNQYRLIRHKKGKRMSMGYGGCVSNERDDIGENIGPMAFRGLVPTGSEPPMLFPHNPDDCYSWA